MVIETELISRRSCVYSLAQRALLRPARTILRTLRNPSASHFHGASGSTLILERDGKRYQVDVAAQDNSRDRPQKQSRRRPCSSRTARSVTAQVAKE